MDSTGPDLIGATPKMFDIIDNAFCKLNIKRLVIQSVAKDLIEHDKKDFMFSESYQILKCIGDKILRYALDDKGITLF